MEKRNPDIAFTRNPIRFTDSHSEGEVQRSYTVLVGGETAYKGYYTATATIDISEIAHACVPSVPDPDDGLGIGVAQTMLQLEGPEEFLGRRMVVNRESGPPLKLPFYALPGGVSPQNFKRLAELDTDIFAARLLDKKHNFFLTTRTHGWRIVMDELEVFPLTFVNLTASGEDEDSEIEVKASGTDFSVSMDNNDQGIYAIDIGKIRMKIAEQQGFLGSVFDVLCDGYLACQIVIRESLPELETTLVKFRNSLGAFELLHLNGTRNAKTSIDEAKTAGRRFDSTTGRFERIMPRSSVMHTFDTETGFKDNDELAFILDMAASEEVYFRGSAGWTKVIPSIEGVTTSDPQTKPTSIKVSFTLAEDRDNQTPDIVSLEDFERPRIFSVQQSDQFN